MSTVARKLVMAVSGAVLVLFLILHAAGNLKFFSGAASFDSYAAWLRELGKPLLPHEGFLWLQRFGLLAAVGVHMWAAVSLAITNKKARYRHRLVRHDSYAARTMLWGGIIIAAFVVYHVLDLTTRHLNPAGHGSLYQATLADFAPNRWYVTAFYVIAVLLLGLHLRHGVYSAVQTLGWRGSKPLATVVSVLICAGFLAVPVAVTTGWVN